MRLLFLTTLFATSALVNCTNSLPDETYVSNLQSLDYVGLALVRNPGGWDANHLWAPHVVKSGNTYWMLYTGVSGTGATSKQRVGLATSTDLTN